MKKGASAEAALKNKKTNASAHYGACGSIYIFGGTSFQFLLEIDRAVFLLEFADFLLYYLDNLAVGTATLIFCNKMQFV